MKLPTFLEVLRKGISVAEPETWKKRSAATMAIGALIMAAMQFAKEYGYEIPLDTDDVTAIAGFVVVLVGVWSTYATSSKVGVFPPERDPSGNLLPEAGSKDDRGEATTDKSLPTGPGETQ